MIKNITAFLKSMKLLDFALLVILILTYMYVGVFVQEDMKIHFLLLNKVVSVGSFPIPPIYYLVLFIFTPFVEHVYLAITITSVILGILTFLKFRVTKHYFSTLIKQQLPKNTLTFLSISMLVVISIISGKHMYIGELSANMWHNSTTIFLFPFSLLLFYITMNLVKKGYNKKDALLFLLLIAVNALIKPSFLFVFSFLPIVYFLYYKWDKNTTLFVFGGALAVSIIALEFAFLFLMENDPFVFDKNQEKNSVVFMPLNVWSHYSSNIMVSIISGIAFPLSVLISKFNSIRKDFFLVFSWVQLIIAVLIYSMFTETGSRMFDANMGWQIFPSLYILFILSLVFLFNEFTNKNKKLNFQGKILFSIFCLHLVSGLIYLGKICIFREYF